MATTLTQNPQTGVWEDSSGSSEGLSTAAGNFNPQTGENTGTVASLPNSVGSFAPQQNNQSPNGGYSQFTLNMASLMNQLQNATQQGNANLSGTKNALVNESVTTAPGYNPNISPDANATNMASATNAFTPAITGASNFMQNFQNNSQVAATNLQTASENLGPKSYQQVSPGNTLVDAFGNPIYGLGAGNGSDAYTNFSNLQFNTAQGQAAGKIASDIKVSSDLIDSSFQTLSNVEAKYGINASQYPDVADLNRALMSKVGGGAGAVAAFADASNALSSAISQLINNTSAFTPQEIGDMNKELNSASLNPSALQELYDTVRQTATNRYNAQIAQALYYDKLGTQSGTTNQTPVTGSPTSLSNNTAPAGFAWNPNVSTTTPNTENGQSQSVGVLAPKPVTPPNETLLQTLEGIPGVFGLNLGL